MLPAKQDFSSKYLVGPQVDDRLIIEFELLILYGFPQIIAESEIFIALDIQIRGVIFESVLPFVFCQEYGSFGTPYELFGARLLLTEKADTDAGPTSFRG